MIGRAEAMLLGRPNSQMSMRKPVGDLENLFTNVINRPASAGPIPRSVFPMFSPPGSEQKGEFFPDPDLLVDLCGGNGCWKQRKAQKEWARQKAQKEKEEQERKLQKERERLSKLDRAERRRKREEAERLRVLQEQERERLRKLDEERLLRELEEERERKRLEEERQRQRRLPRQCETCSGSGRCGDCRGKGSNTVLYLSRSVEKVSSARSTGSAAKGYGSWPQGCVSCGGIGDNSTWGGFRAGSGKCATCAGCGKVPAPKEGWQDLPK